MPQEEVDRVTSEILVDLFTDGEFDAAFAGEPPLLNERERSHMHDVARLVRHPGDSGRRGRDRRGRQRGEDARASRGASAR